jgi:cytidyltransferase-like protein
MKPVVVTGGFDNLGSRQLRLLQEASKLGPVTVLLWPDETLQRLMGKPPKFPLHERLYLLKAVRYVSRVAPVAAGLEVDVLPALEEFRPGIWVDDESTANETRRAFSQKHGWDYRVLSTDQLKGFPDITPESRSSGRKKVVVTGCYDWFHSGHVRFFEEVSAYGDLYVILGHDANIRLLKGEGHPLVPQAERQYVVGSIRYVTQALISTGQSWLDADPEIQRLKPDIYAVNEDGDRGGKREYCLAQGIEYLVLKRVPAPGLPARSSTELRGF